ncbi:hypothetical protein AnigIFM63309_002121 [Aspergillus niger]|nr:hypothetical protein AnigIFM63309_002121 [Aspergillus niger]
MGAPFPWTGDVGPGEYAMSKIGGGTRARKRERSGGQTVRRVEQDDEKKAQKLLPEQGRARPKGSKGSLHKHGDDKRPGKFEAKKEEAEELGWRVTEESRRREAGRWPEAD